MNSVGAMVDRATIFGSEVEAYDRLRPRYPTAVVDLIVAGEPELAVDAGCGTGIAARQVMARGVAVLGVEPDEAMAAVARSQGTQTTITVNLKLLANTIEFGTTPTT